MSKVVVNLGYRSVVVDMEKALAIAHLLEDAELYESKYHSAEPGKSSYNTHHIYPMTQEHSFTMQLITNESYSMYKLAGKPDNN